MSLPRLPVWTLLVCGVAVLVFFTPSLGGALIFDRNAIVAGEWWRLVTGNLVHLSSMHLILDVVALLIVGTIAELRGLRYVAVLYVTAGAIVGVAVYLAEPELFFFGGLSGVVTAVTVYFCLDGVREPGYWRWLCLSGLTFVTIKIGMEFGMGMSLLATSEPQPFVPVPVSHLAGACVAVVFTILTKIQQSHPTIDDPLGVGQG